MKKDHRVKYIEEFHKQWLDKEQEPVSHMDEKWKKPGEIQHSKMDTQGMSGPADPNYKGKAQEYKPATVIPRRLFTSEYVKELKILLNEVLDEREGKMNYTSFFDVEKFKHTVDEEEPRYVRPAFKNLGYKWENNKWVPTEVAPLRLDEIQE